MNGGGTVVLIDCDICPNESCNDAVEAEACLGMHAVCSGTATPPVCGTEDGSRVWTVSAGFTVTNLNICSLVQECPPVENVGYLCGGGGPGYLSAFIGWKKIGGTCPTGAYSPSKALPSFILAAGLTVAAA